MVTHGLSTQQLNLINSVLAPYKSKINKVGIFGSRATGRFKSYSDLDLVIYGDLAFTQIDRLFTEFDESLLSIKVDVVLYGEHLPLALKKHIDEVVQILPIE